MRRLNNILWGIVLIGAGVICALNKLGIIAFNGWWTFLIIVPCLIGLITNKEKSISFIGLIIGIFLLLEANDIIDFKFLWKLLIPIILIIFGFRLIFKDVFNSKSKEIIKNLNIENKTFKQHSAFFSEIIADYNDEDFIGAELSTTFGSIKCDLRNSNITQDAVINISCIFGGSSIYTPDNINLKITSNSFFGGVSDKRKIKSKDNQYTLYINASCIFGGIDIY